MSLTFKATTDHPKGAKTMFFIHGWPDNSHTWDMQVTLNAY